MTRSDRLFLILFLALGLVIAAAATALPPGTMQSEPDFLVGGEF